MSTKRRPTLPKELERFTTTDSNYVAWHRRKISPTESTKLLHDFLHATLDEVRLYCADRYANLALKITDLDDARHFRQGVLRREASGDIEFQRQRDHAAHTLHNYLLGWYCFEANSGLREEMTKAVKCRFPIAQYTDPIEGGRWVFSHAWAFNSLLHDVGYLFEGGLETLSVDIHNQRVKRGAEVVQEYFRNRVWLESPLAAANDRARVREWTRITEPDFSPFSVTAVGDSLRTLGNLDDVWAATLAELKDMGVEISALAALNMTGQGDAFQVWQNHYQVYSPSMVARVGQLENAFYALIWEGLPGLALRVLDHGVSGGLLLLLYSTYYFQIIFGLRRRAQIDVKNQELGDLLDRIEKRIRQDAVIYDAHWWWTVIVWATAATAMHNLQQQERPWPGCKDDNGPLKLSEDPLAYLGILVDVLQEWDRYTVSRTSIFTGKLPLQGKDVKLWTNNELVHVDYGDAGRANKVRGSLTLALQGWDRIVKVLPA